MLKRMEAPLTLWTIPEVASVGLSVDQALAQGMQMATAEDGSIVVGYAYFKVGEQWLCLSPIHQPPLPP